jgi:ferritin-like metal-binding protein YciE
MIGRDRTALAANAQAVEHYEIARYGSLIAWFKAADVKLTEVANSELNEKAAQHAKAA